MGVMDEGMVIPENNGSEVSKASGNLVQNLNYEPLAPGNLKLDYEGVVDQSVEKNEAGRAQRKEMGLVSVDESFSGREDTGLSAGDTSQSVGAIKGELMENEKMSPVQENTGGQFDSRPIDIENMDLPPGFSYPSPANGSLKPADDMTDNFGHLNENEETRVQARTRKSRTPVSSSWVLRPPKSNEKPNSPEINDTANEGSANVKKERRGRKKKNTTENKVNEFSRTKTHLRYLMHRIKYEQNLIDAYSAEGWRGQSLEKLKPEKELQRAKSQILRYKLKIRELFQHLDSSLATGKLSSLFDSLGEIDSEDIFCAKCGSKDLPLDNDIILCDGACERGFHQLCLEPPLLKEDVPPGDESWFCPGCSCKADCIDMLKDVHETTLSIIDSWEKIFPEALGNKLDDARASSSDDSEDDDYDPDKPDKVEKAEGDECCSEESNYYSAPGDLETTHDNNETGAALPFDDSEDDSFDPTAADPEEQVEQGSSSSDFTSDSEDLRALIGDASKDQEITSSLSGQTQQERSAVGKARKGSLKGELAILMETFEEPVSGKRRIERLDYQKLHKETFGDDASDSSDEDFDGSANSKKRKTNKTDKMSSDQTPLANSEISTKAESEKKTPKGRKTNKAENMSSGQIPLANSETNTMAESQKKTPKRRKNNKGEKMSSDQTPLANSEINKSQKETPKRRKTNKSGKVSSDQTPLPTSEINTKAESQKETPKRRKNNKPQKSSSDQTPLINSEISTKAESEKKTPKGRKTNKAENMSSDQTPLANSEISAKAESQKETPNREKTNKADKMSSDQTPLASTEISTRVESQNETPRVLKRTRKQIQADGGTPEPMTAVGSGSGSSKRLHKRISDTAKQRLYISFNENKFPEKPEKEKLANELGITFQQVDKWFGNARWSFNHKPQTKSNIVEKPTEPNTE